MQILQISLLFHLAKRGTRSSNRDVTLGSQENLFTLKKIQLLRGGMEKKLTGRSLIQASNTWMTCNLRFVFVGDSLRIAPW